jgi:asparagine synthase (glutamine-hydrolysing)
MLPRELWAVLDKETVRVGLRRLNLLARIGASMSPDPIAPASRVAALESTNYMRNQLLRDADWAGMAQSVEIRTPLVDIKLLKTLSAVVPLLGPGLGKHALASSPTLPLPLSILRRPKTGFSIPTGQWTANADASTASNKGAMSRTWAKEVYEYNRSKAKVPNFGVDVGL